MLTPYTLETPEYDPVEKRIVTRKKIVYLPSDGENDMGSLFEELLQACSLNVITQARKPADEGTATALNEGFA